MTAHPDTIGTIDWDGKTYEIDWPRCFDDETQRDDFGVIYLNGTQVGEVIAHFGERFDCEDDVMEAAMEAIMNGEVDT